MKSWYDLKEHKGNTAQRTSGDFCTSSACIFSVILHKNPLTGDSLPARFLHNLTKNLTAHLTHNLCAVSPKLKRRKETLQSILILALVLGLGTICVLTYLHARGGFLR